MGNLLLKLVISYVEAHPDQVVDLISEAAQAGVHALKAHNAKQPA
jgi:hypothetical protein